jgi:hypothetical protein
MAKYRIVRQAGYIDRYKVQTKILGFLWIRISRNCSLKEAENFVDYEIRYDKRIKEGRESNPRDTVVREY